MKRIVASMLLCSVLILCLSGCSRGNNSENEVKEDLPVELQKDSLLVHLMTMYLFEIHADIEPPDDTTKAKINAIKKGKQALHVGFDSSSCYFVGAYCGNAHESEGIDYCCLTDYTWVKYERANEIAEKYKDLSFVVAFQINRATFVTDIMSKDAEVPSMEHFQIYTPNFAEGVNTSGEMTFDDTFIYLNWSKFENVYHTLSFENNRHYTFPCINIDGEYFIPVKIYTILPDGSRKDHNASIAYDFGEYYDALMGVMNTEGYSVTDEEGRTAFYGLIKLEDFCRCIEE